MTLCFSDHTSSVYNFLLYTQIFLAVESVYILTLVTEPQFTKQIKVELQWPIQGRKLRLLDHPHLTPHSDLSSP